MSEAKIVLSAQDRATAVLRQLKGEMQGLDGVVRGLGGAFGLLAPTLAATLGPAALGAIIKGTNDGLLKIKDLSEATGSAIEKISGLEDVARKAGSSIDDVGGILIKFNTALKDTGKTKELAAAFDALGLSAEELKRLDPAEALLQTAKALDQFADDGNKARLVQELFGRSIKDAGPYLHELAEAGELNGKVTKQQVIEADKFNKELAKLTVAAQDGARALTGPMVSAMNEMIDKFREGAKEGKSFYRVIFEEQLKILGLMKDAPKVGDLTAGIGGRAFYNPLKPSLPDTLTKPDEPKAKKVAEKRGASAIFDVKEAFRASELAQQALVNETLRTTQLAEAEKERADALKLVAEQQSRLNDLLAATPTGQIEAARHDMQLLAAAFEEGTISAEQFNEAASTRLHLMADDAKQVTENLNEQLGLVFSSAAGDAIAHWQGVRAVLKGVLADLAQIVLKKTLTDPLGKAVGDSLPKFDFGSLIANFVPKFASGTPYVPRDMLAVVHKGERITPAAQNRGGLGGATFVFNIAPGADADSFRRSQRQIEADMTRTMRRAGGIA